MLSTLPTLLCLLMLGSARVVAGGEVYDRFPDVIDPAGRYVIYSHGLILSKATTRGRSRRSSASTISRRSYARPPRVAASL